MPKRRSLHYTLIWRFILIAVIPTVVVGAVTYSILAQVSLERVERELTLSATVLKQEARTLTEQPHAILSQISSFLHRHELHVEFLDTQLDMSVGKSRYFESIFIVDNQGLVVHAGLPPGMVGHREDYLQLDLSNRAFLRDAIRSGETNWSVVHNSIITGDRVISVALPHGNEFLVGNIRVESLQGTIETISEEQHTLVFITDSTGVAVFHLDPAVVSQQVSLRHLAPVADGITQEPEQTYHFAYGRSNFIGAMKRIDATGWVVVVSQDLNTAFAQLRRIRNTFLVTVLISILLAALWAVAVSSRLVRPLSTLAKGAQTISSGDYGLELAHQPHLETEELARSFREMVQAVHERERRYAALALTAPVGIIRTDSRGNCVYINPAFTRITGLSLAQVQASGWQELIHPEDKFQLLSQTEKLAKTGEPLLMECRIRTKGGSLAWVEINAVREGEAHAGSRGFVGTISNITERKEAEWALMESEVSSRRLLESTKAIPWAIDLASGRFTYIGPQIEELLGYPAGSWRTLDDWADRLHQEDRASSVEYCRKQTARGQDHDFEYRAVAADGSLVWVKDIVSVNRDSAGKTILQGFMIDITEHREAEQALADSEARLRQSQKMEAIGTLAGGIAHDFNNLLFAILGNADLLALRLPPSSPAANSVRDIRQAGRRAADLVQQILSFARQDHIEPENTETLAILKEVVKLLRSTLPTTIEINLDIDCESLMVHAVATEIHQVFMNLCTNAGQAMLSSGGLLEVTAQSAEFTEDNRPAQTGLEPGAYAVFSFRDTGQGMDAATIEHIFEPFFTTKQVGQGTGLGLSVVHGIIHRLKGVITVNSVLGSGSQFIVYLPLIESETLSRISHPESLPGGDETVLVVDDEAILVEMVCGMLKSLGYTTEGHSSSRDALKAFKARPGDFDLVITDQTMPEMTGTELAEEILKDHPEQRIILSTGFSYTVDELIARRSGIASFLVKPLTLETLSQKVRWVLDDAGNVEH